MLETLKSTLTSSITRIAGAFNVSRHLLFSGRGTPYDGLYRQAPSERGTFYKLQVYERVGILLVEVYERVGESAIWLRPKGVPFTGFRYMRG